MKPKTRKMTMWVGLAVLAICVTAVLAANPYGQTTRSRMADHSVSSGHAQAGTLCSVKELMDSQVYSMASSQSGTTTDPSSAGTNAEEQTGTSSSYNNQSGTTSSFNDRSETASPYNDQSGTTSSYQADSAWNQSHQDSEVLGSVEEVIIDNQKDDVSYVILSANGQYYPVPWKAFVVKDKDISAASNGQNLRERQYQKRQNTSQEMAYQGQTDRVDSAQADSQDRQKPKLYLNLSRDQFRGAPSVSSMSLDDVCTPAIKQKVDAFYSQTGIQGYSRQQGTRQNQQGYQADRQTTRRDNDTGIGQTDDTRQNQQWDQDDQQTARRDYDDTDLGQTDDAWQSGDMSRQAAMDKRNLLKASDVIGMDVQSTADEDLDLGNVQDIVVDARKGQVAYGLIAFGGFLNINEKVAAVPWSELTINPQQQTAQLNASRQELDAAVLEGGNIQQLSEPQFAQNIHDTFNTEPYWGIYGFVGDDTAADPNQTDDQVDQRNRMKQKDKVQQNNSVQREDENQTGRY